MAGAARAGGSIDCRLPTSGRPRSAHSARPRMLGSESSVARRHAAAKGRESNAYIADKHRDTWPGMRGTGARDAGRTPGCGVRCRRT
ncbi:DUF2271 domain-containing protein, partial [Burkholderia pseudomallei]|nr:DUF2271 domain-containing protein [Burkholderia pseudomallei]